MNKNYVALFFFTLIQYVSIGQTSYKLDEKNGFKHFKLGSSLNSINNIIKQESILLLKGVTTYKYVGTDITEYSGVKIENINLYFFQNKLYKIYIRFSNFTNNDYSITEFNTVTAALVSSFGNFIECHNNDPSLLNCAIWDGNKVRLDNVRMNASNKSDGLIGGYLLFIDKDIEKQQQNSEID